MALLIGEARFPFPSGSLGFLNLSISQIQSRFSAQTKHIGWKGGKWLGRWPALCSENPFPPSHGSWPPHSALEELSAEQQRRSAYISEATSNICLFVF